MEIDLVVVGRATTAETLHGHIIVANESLADLPEGERIFILAHEIGHVVSDHWHQMGGLYRRLDSRRGDAGARQTRWRGRSGVRPRALPIARSTKPTPTRCERCSSSGLHPRSRSPPSCRQECNRTPRRTRGLVNAWPLCARSHGRKSPPRIDARHPPRPPAHLGAQLASEPRIAWWLSVPPILWRVASPFELVQNQDAAHQLRVVVLRRVRCAGQRESPPICRLNR